MTSTGSGMTSTGSAPTSAGSASTSAGSALTSSDSATILADSAMLFTNSNLLKVFSESLIAISNHLTTTCSGVLVLLLQLVGSLQNCCPNSALGIYRSCSQPTWGALIEQAGVPRRVLMAVRSPVQGMAGLFSHAEKRGRGAVSSFWIFAQLSDVSGGRGAPWYPRNEHGSIRAGTFAS